MSNLFEVATIRDFENIVTAVMQIVAAAADGA
jgi:hypothetical protein